MNNIVDYLLIGNTRLHWAVNKNSSYKFSNTLVNDSLPKNIDLKKLIWASVGKYPTSNLLQKKSSNYQRYKFNKNASFYRN